MKPLRSSSPTIDKFVIRLPVGLRNKIKELAELNHRSMNAEIIMVLEQHVEQQQALELRNKGTDNEEEKVEPELDPEVNKRLEELKKALLGLSLKAD